MSFKENIIPSIFILIIIVILVLVTKYAPWLICTRNPFSGNCLVAFVLIFFHRHTVTVKDFIIDTKT